MDKEILFQKYIKKRMEEVVSLFSKQNPDLKVVQEEGGTIFVKKEPVLIDGLRGRKKMLKRKFSSDGENTFLETYWEWELL